VKVLILGGSGMLGHKLWQTCATRFDSYTTVSGDVREYTELGIFDSKRLIGDVRAEDATTLERAIGQVRPDVIVNCVGVVKQHPLASDTVASSTVNSLFPHRAAQLAHDRGARFIHISTDCVFSGLKGNYTEDDLPDPTDLYGRSKLLGEVTGENCLTIRTSMIGRELRGSRGLLEWFLACRGESVHGFSRAIFSGLTTQTLSEVIARLIVEHPHLTGLWHVAANPISKFDLLTLVKQTYGLVIDIERDESFVCDRSLNGERFRAATGIQIPGWTEMIERLRADDTPYERLRKDDA
jgi:dTDP-4-dehydrorhamnose reductase